MPEPFPASKENRLDVKMRNENEEMMREMR